MVEQPLILEGSDNATLTLFGAIVLDDLIWADAYEGSRIFEYQEIVNYNGKQYELLTPAQQYFKQKELYDYFGTPIETSEILCELIPTSENS